MNYYFEDFTEQNYKSLLLKAKQKWQFIGFDEYNESPLNAQKSGGGGSLCLWRHDVDASPHRSLALAIAENALSIKATYYVHLNSIFYNALEVSVRDIILKISELGHDIGIHYDCEFYDNEDLDVKKLEKNLDMLKVMFKHIYNIDAKSFSFHNPTKNVLDNFTNDSYSGLINAYSKSIKEKFRYCSDSNGYWRFDRLEDVLDEETGDIQILTHPALWTKDVLSPYERIELACEGRKKAVLDNYSDLLKRLGRINIKGEM